MLRHVLVATFDSANSLLGAVHPIRSARFRIYDVYAPYPIHGLDQAMGIRPTRLPFVALIVGLCGLCLALSFQFYGAILDWPLDVGGKPDNSTLAFVPICFELTVLLSGLSVVAALFLRARLYPGKVEQLPAPGVTDDTFALVLRRPEAATNLRRAHNILMAHGAIDVEEKVTEL